jgi:hypothetical protein
MASESHRVQGASEKNYASDRVAADNREIAASVGSQGIALVARTFVMEQLSDDRTQ